MPFSPDTLIRRSSSPVETTVGAEIVLMSLDAGNCYGLGETGSDVWRLLAEPTAVSDLVASLKEIYEAPEGEIERDVEELLQKMQELNLIELS